MLRVLLVIPSFEGGGAERAWATLLQAFPESRVSCLVARFRGEGVFERLLPPGLPTYLVRGRRGDPTVVLRLARLIRRTNPDIVLAVLRYANVVAILASLLAGRRTRVVINEQNIPEVEFAQRCGASFKRQILKLLYPRAHGVTAISRGIAEALVAGAGVPAPRLRVIPNPVDLEAATTLGAQPPTHPWLLTPGDPPVILAAGRLVPQKGFDMLLRAFRHVRDLREARLIILGAGPLGPALTALRDSLALSACVDFPGFDPNPYRYFSRAACLVVSSRYEGFGNVIVEAMACGTPVVATRCPSGPEEIITDGTNGLLVPMDDVPAMAAAIVRVLDDRSLTHTLRQAGRARALDFSAERVAEAYCSFLETVMATPIAA
jgi:glycosyltransferase involved in cell wall biosynthesis